MTLIRLAFVALVVVAIGACAAPSGAGPQVPAPSLEPAPATADAATSAAPVATDPPATSASSRPAAGATPAATAPATAEPAATPVEGWRGMPLVDARTGSEFTIGSLGGRLVAIEPMAAWCSNCLRQQGQARKALKQLDSDQVVYISLGVDFSEQAGDLAAYADREGFGWTFAVASKEVARALAAEFGDQVLSPPSTPFILVGPDGKVIEHHFGSRDADELAALLAQHLP